MRVICACSYEITSLPAQAASIAFWGPISTTHIHKHFCGSQCVSVYMPALRVLPPSLRCAQKTPNKIKRKKNVSILLRRFARLGSRTQYAVICAHRSDCICEYVSSNRGAANRNDSSSAHGHVHDGWRRSTCALSPHSFRGGENATQRQAPSSW